MDVSVCWWVAGVLSGCLPLPMVTHAPQPPTFALAWVHSVERTVWLETWRIEAKGKDGQELQMVQHSAQVKGSGAGIDPPEGAEWKAGWWVWVPQAAMHVQALSLQGTHLGAGAQPQTPWRLCTGSALSTMPVQMPMNQWSSNGEGMDLPKTLNEQHLNCMALPPTVVLKVAHTAD